MLYYQIAAFVLVTAPLHSAASELLEVTAPSPVRVSVAPSGTLALEAGDRSLAGCGSYLASRICGTEGWSEEKAVYHLISEAGGALTLAADFKHAKATVTVVRDDAGRVGFSGRLVSTSSEPIEVARFHYLDGSVPDPSLNLLSMRHYELPGRIIHPAEKLPAPRKASWGWSRLDEPVHGRPNTAISGDSGMLAPDWNTPGFFFGFTGPGKAFGEIGMRTAEKDTSFFLAVLLDGIRIERGATRVLETAVVSYGDPQDELRHWIGVCRDVLGPARVRPPIVGYCSWYQLGQRVKPVDIRRAITSFGPYAKPPGGRLIQIDDGYQVTPGDWSGRGEWKDELDKMPAEIKAKDFIPGIWIAPTAIQATHPIVKEHPDWLQRDKNGEFCIRFHNWKRFEGMSNSETYFLEPDHPGAREFILKTLRDLRSKGWDYFKIDFAYTVSSDRVKYDPGKTTCESLRDQWRLFREGLGGDAIINSCNGGMWRYTIGTVDVSRIGGDIGGNIRSLRRNLAEMMLRSHANGAWFQADPDVFYMRKERSSLNFEQSHLLTATQGLLGTAFLTSDFADQWDPAAEAVVRRYWNEQGARVPAMLRILFTNDGLPAALAVAYGGGEYALAVYNWDTGAKDVAVRLADVRLPTNVSPAQPDLEPAVVGNGTITITAQPGESLRIVHLSAARR